MVAVCVSCCFMFSYLYLTHNPSVCRVSKIGGGLVILMVCAINMYFVVVYVTTFNSVWLYVLASFLYMAYLAFVGYLVSKTVSL